MSYRSALALPDSAENRELFEMVGPGYRLPAWLEKTTEELKPEARVIVSLPKMPWLPKQRALMEETLGRLCVRRAECGWVLTWEQASACLSKSSYSEPADVVIWNPGEPIPTPGPPRSFIHDYCNHRDAVERNPARAAILWASFQKFAFWWLLNRNAPLDLGFVKLQTLPLRRNWMTALHQRYLPLYGRTGFSMEKLLRKYWAQLTAWDERHDVIRWNIEAEPTDKFHETMRGIEQERKRAVPSSKRYATKIADLLKLYAKRIIEAFEAATLAEKDRETAAIRRGTAGKNVGNRFCKPEPAEAVGDDAGYDLDRGDGEPSVAASVEKDVAGSDEGVHEVQRDLQSRDEDLRAGTNMAASGIEPSDFRDDRLRVLSSVQEQTAGELLACRTSRVHDADVALATDFEQPPTGGNEKGDGE